MLYVCHVYERKRVPELMSCRLREQSGRTRRSAYGRKSLAERLYYWRRRNDFSQSEAAGRLRISTRTLQEWEQGRAEPRHLALEAINRLMKS